MNWEKKLQWLNRGYKLNEELEGLEYKKNKLVRQDGPQRRKLKKTIYSQEEKINSISCEIMAAINRMPDTRDRQILTWRFINFLDYEEIARRMNYRDISSVSRKIKKAGKKIDI